ncbi:MAG: hypothetical protein NT157_06250 [Candidatus Micrarchaeota archaeon]|nr:hypothetical protein [Candidatus Micrarchaeota archaeon]
MRISRREAELLDFLAGKKADTKEVAQALGMRKPNLFRHTKKLASHGLIRISKKGRTRELALEDRIAFGASNMRSAFPDIKLGEILAGKTPYLLAHIKSGRDFKISGLDLPEATSKRILAKLRKAGFVSMRKKGVYHLRTEAEIVAEFCRQTLMAVHSTEAEGELGKISRAVYSFDSASELGAIFVTEREAAPKHYWPTAYTVAHEFGLQTIQAGRWYYANNKPDLEDVALHILAVSKDARGVIYATVLILKNKRNPRLLLRKRQTFGLGREYLLGFVEFLESRGGKPFEGVDSFEEIGVMLDETV